ncbi:MAG: cache domain-containing protein [Anaerolineales bacterium]|jgi:putative nucleotidyltransferase with HDIG domain
MIDKTIHFFKQFRSSIQAKITVPYLLLSLIVAMGGAYLITNWLMEDIDHQFDSSLKDAASICADIIVQEEDLILETIRLIAHSKGIDNYLLENNSEGLREIVYPLALNSGDDLVVLLNVEGENLLTLNKNDNETIVFESSKGSDEFHELGFVKDVLDQRQDAIGDKFAGLHVVDREITLMISGPVEDANGDLVGIVLVGRRLENLLVELKQETLYHVSIYDLSGHLVESTLHDQASLPPELSKEIIEYQGEEGYIYNFKILDNKYRELISVFELRGKDDYGLLGVAFPTSFLENTNRKTRLQVFTYTTVLLFMTTITGIYISRLITEPIQSLKSAALQVSAGDLDVSVEPIGEDEVAVLTQSFNEMIVNLKSSKAELLEAYDKSLEGWAKALELRDKETEGHTRRVTDMTIALARKLGIEGDQLENMRRGALLHDIGKVGVPDSILQKPGKLTDDEFEIIKKHPIFAFEMLSDITFLKSAIDIPYCHHEKWDGSGYPRGLRNTEIPIAARIFAVVDVWDAITSDRIYRKAMTKTEALKVIQDGEGNHFDPEITEIFINKILPSL